MSFRGVLPTALVDGPEADPDPSNALILILPLECRLPLFDARENDWDLCEGRDEEISELVNDALEAGLVIDPDGDLMLFDLDLPPPTPIPTLDD